MGEGVGQPRPSAYPEASSHLIVARFLASASYRAASRVLVFTPGLRGRPQQVLSKG